MKSLVRIIAIAASVCYVVFVGIGISMVVTKEWSFISFLGFALSVSLSLILLWALDNALARIERLENILLKKDIITDDDVKLETFGYVEEKPENVAECKKCGYQLFSEDKICPNCKTPRDDIKNDK